jgi:hypothetical protein
MLAQAYARGDELVERRSADLAVVENPEVAVAHVIGYY